MFRKKQMYDVIENQMDKIQKTRRKFGVGEVLEIVQISDNIKSKLEKSANVYRQVDDVIFMLTSQPRDVLVLSSNYQF